MNAPNKIVEQELTINNKTAKKYLDDNEYRELLELLNIMNKNDGDLTNSQIHRLGSLAELIHLRIHKKQMKQVAYFGFALLIYIAFFLVMFTIMAATGSSVVETIIDYTTVFFNIAVLYFMIWSKEFQLGKANWNSMPLWVRLAWWSGFLLNMVLVAKFIIDLVGGTL